MPRQAEPAQVAPVAGTQPSTPDISGKSTFVTAAQDKDWPAADEEITAPTDLGSIFRAYDIRGVVGATLTPNVIYKIGLAIGSEAIQLGQQALRQVAHCF